MGVEGLKHRSIGALRYVRLRDDDVTVAMELRVGHIRALLRCHSCTLEHVASLSNYILFPFVLRVGGGCSKAEAISLSVGGLSVALPLSFNNLPVAQRASRTIR